MRAWWLVVLVSGAAFAQQREPRLRTFIGGFSSGAFVSDGSFHAGLGGIAGDVGVQFDEHVSLSGALRASTVLQINWLQLAPSIEWSQSFFSIGIGVGGAVSLNFIPIQSGGVRPLLVAPLTFGFTWAERPDGVRLGSVRLNVELAFVWNPLSSGFGGSVGISLGRQSR